MLKPFLFFLFLAACAVMGEDRVAVSVCSSRDFHGLFNASLVNFYAGRTYTFPSDTSVSFAMLSESCTLTGLLRLNNHLLLARCNYKVAPLSSTCSSE